MGMCLNTDPIHITNRLNVGYEWKGGKKGRQVNSVRMYVQNHKETVFSPQYACITLAWRRLISHLAYFIGIRKFILFRSEIVVGKIVREPPWLFAPWLDLLCIVFETRFVRELTLVIHLSYGRTDYKKKIFWMNVRWMQEAAQGALMAKAGTIWMNEWTNEWINIGS